MQVPSGGDAAVSAFGATHERQTLETFYDGFGGWRWRGFGPDLATTTAVGTLVLDIFDGHTQQLICRGTSERAAHSFEESEPPKRA